MSSWMLRPLRAASYANQAGEDNRNVARMALLLAGYPTRFLEKR